MHETTSFSNQLREAARERWRQNKERKSTEGKPDKNRGSEHGAERQRMRRRAKEKTENIPLD